MIIINSLIIFFTSNKTVINYNVINTIKDILVLVLILLDRHAQAVNPLRKMAALDAVEPAVNIPSILIATLTDGVKTREGIVPKQMVAGPSNLFG